MVLPYISETTAASIKAKFERLFATSMLLGDTVDVMLWRDPEMDGVGVQVPPQRVLMTLASRESGLQRGQASVFTGTDGDFKKLFPFDVRAGDIFTVDDIHGEIKAVLPPDAVGVVTAPFTLKA